MLIPTGMRYTATMSGSVVKLVDCGACKSEYVYRMVRTASGEGFSFLFLDNDGAWERAQRRAEQAVAKILAKDCDVVPCASCGHIQSHMFRKAAEEHTRWARPLLIGLVFGSVLALVVWLGAHGVLSAPRSGKAHPVGTVALGVLVLSSAGCIVLFALRAVIRLTYDPNQEDLHLRRVRGRHLAKLRTEFEEMLRNPDAQKPPSDL